jgi:hypothetical protein
MRSAATKLCQPHPGQPQTSGQHHRPGQENVALGERLLRAEASNKQLLEVIASLKRYQEEQDDIIRDLAQTLASIKLLHGLLPICAGCKKIRDDNGAWNYIETYISKHSEAQFTHGLCPTCEHDLYPQLHGNK